MNIYVWISHRNLHQIEEVFVHVIVADFLIGYKCEAQFIESNAVNRFEGYFAISLTICKYWWVYGDIKICGSQCK